jgi:hypothetical protein
VRVKISIGSRSEKEKKGNVKLGKKRDNKQFDLTRRSL